MIFVNHVYIYILPYREMYFFLIIPENQCTYRQAVQYFASTHTYICIVQLSTCDGGRETPGSQYSYCVGNIFVGNC